MAESVSDQEVASARQRVDALREEVAKAKDDATTAALAGTNRVSLDRLEDEEERLKAELARYQEAASPAAVEVAVATAIAPPATIVPPGDDDDN